MEITLNMIKAVSLLAFIGAVLGRPNDETRIINGDKAHPGDYPWQVSLQEPSTTGSDYRHFCGGSLISPNFVITAGHCLRSPDQVTVYAGSVDKILDGVRIQVSAFIQHPDYSPYQFSMDYALVQLMESVTLTNTIQPIPIPGPEFNSASEFTGPAVTTGWGYINYSATGDGQDELPQILQVANLPVLSDISCYATWESIYISSSMICAGGSGEGTCMDDSGGPLVQDINGVPTLIGVTSWVPSTCSPDLPSGWAKLSTVRDWIIDNTDLQ